MRFEAGKRQAKVVGVKEKRGVRAECRGAGNAENPACDGVAVRVSSRG